MVRINENPRQISYKSPNIAIIPRRQFCEIKVPHCKYQIHSQRNHTFDFICENSANIVKMYENPQKIS